ncbi:hypothetical protein IGI04_019397, partial [Brassica rapa subsp. trilocularis]
MAKKLLLLGIRNKMHYEYEINVGQDPWISSTPVRSARSIVPVVNLKMTEWDARLIEQYVDQEDIPLIQSLSISRNHRRDTFCWSYTKNEPSITKLQAFAWKVKAPQNIFLIWQLISGQVAVTRNLVRQNMRCDNYCPRSGEAEETVSHATFECPPALQARNDKLFRGIDRDPLELVMYATSECQAWYNAKDTIHAPPQAQTVEETQALSLDNICM